MESKNVKYGGLTTLPDDYQSVDGSLAFATNAIYEDEAVKIIPSALSKNLIVERGDKVYVHSMATYTHYIVVHEGDDGVTLYWVDEKKCEENKVYCVTDARVDNGVEKEGGEETGPVYMIGTYAGEFVDMAFVGNTVILSTSESMQYILWKAEDSAYLYLGDSIPKVSMQWGLNLTLGRNVFLDTGITTETKDGVSSGDSYKPVGICTYNHQEVGATNYEFVSLSAEGGAVELTKGMRYRVYQYVTSTKKASPNVHGRRKGSSYKHDNLCDIPERSKEYKYFTASRDYESTFLKVQQRKSSGIVYIEQNTASVEVSATQIKDDEDDGQNNFTAVMGYMNKFVNEQGRKSDRFIYPFMLRYAVKLYDGTWCNLSTPVLLYPNTGYAPFMRIIQQSKFTDVEVYAFTAGLHYELRSFIGEEWSDLILGVGVFVSQQVYPYDQGAAWEAGVASYDYLYSNNEEEYNSDGSENSKYVNDIKGASYGIGCYDGGSTDGSAGSSTSGEDENNATVTVTKDAVYNQFGYISLTEDVSPTSAQPLASDDDPTDPGEEPLPGDDGDGGSGDGDEGTLVNNNKIVAYISAEDAEGVAIALAKGDVSVNVNALNVSYSLEDEYDESTGDATGRVVLEVTRNNEDEAVAGYINITTKITTDDETKEYENALWVSTAAEEAIVPEYDTGDYTVNDINGPLSMYGYNIPASNNGNAVTTVQIAKKKRGEIQDGIQSLCNFYKVGEIDFEDLQESTFDGVYPAVDFEIEEGTLNSLEARETLKEEEVSVDGFQGASLFMYNNRLHVSGGSHSLPALTSSLRQNGKVDLPDGESEDDGGTAAKSCLIPRKDGVEYYRSAVKIKTDEGTRMVMSEDRTAYLAPWLFYPDTRAYQYIEYLPEAFWVKQNKLDADGNPIPETDSEGNPVTDDKGNPVYEQETLDCVVYDMKTHDFLNGSYLLRDVGRYCRAVAGLEDRTTEQYSNWDEKNWGEKDTDVDEGSNKEDDVLNEADANNKVDNLNKIYVSEASNPFYFKNAMVCTAGSGQVLALSSAARALSQGQFGQFPLYAFTDEGIWAMSVGSTGAYETVQPIARDVVPTDAVGSITQLDSAVAFVTARGVMLVEGSNVVCMSDAIDGDFGQFDPRALSGFYYTMQKYLDFDTEKTDETIGKWVEQSFFDFIRSCKMKYDYVHQRITMYSDACDLAYVYSLKSKEWLMQLSALQDNVDSYPDAYALREAGSITYEETDEEGNVIKTVSADCVELVNLSEYDLGAELLPMVMVTRPLKLDSPDIFKTVQDVMQRGYFRQDEKERHIVGTVLYGSPDLFNWYMVKSNVGNKIENVHGSPYKYFRLLVVSRLDAKEGISGCTVWYEPKDTQRMR